MPPTLPRFGPKWLRVSRAFRSWHTIRPSTRGACVPSSTSMECPIPTTGSTAPAGLRAGSSGGVFPTTSSTPSRLPAVLIWSTTTTPWPMPRPVPGLHSGSFDPFRCDDRKSPEVPMQELPGTLFSCGACRRPTGPPAAAVFPVRARARAGTGSPSGCSRVSPIRCGGCTRRRPVP